MSDGSVSIQDQAASSPQERLLGALSRSGLRATPLPNPPEGDWFLFDTQHGPAAFRPLSLGGLGVAAPSEEDGAAAAAQVERAETVLAVVEAAIGHAIEPRAVCAPRDGVMTLIEHGEGEAASVLALCAPSDLAAALPPEGAAAGTVLHRVRAAAPLLGEADIPAPGDLLLLGAQVPCEVAPQAPAGAAAFAATLSLPGDSVAAPVGAGGVVAFETTLSPGQQAALRGGALLTLGPGPAPLCTYTAAGASRTGHIVPLGDQLAFRFD